MPNRLQYAASPYLLQHANNPVDGYPWGPEALGRARAEDKPVFLSVGYAACHWCHVMEHESFENQATADLLNARFVSIKVDREERPDIDSIYMGAIQAMTGQGGWPMTVFMTPDGVPFYGGTYFPPEDSRGMPAFSRVLLAVADAYANRRDELLRAGGELVDRIRASASTTYAGPIGPALCDEAYATLHGMFEPDTGGFGGAPKFPQPMTLEFLMRYHRRAGHALARTMAEKTLHAMADGGMYDQLGGGFHRYSVDAQWLVPHFEKMLYDNALLARTYTEAYQAYGDAQYRRIASETLDYLLREMRHPAGGFFSTQDADSLLRHDGHEKEEGAFFAWELDELQQVLGADARIVAQVYGVTASGNFEGKNVLHIARPPAEVARVLGLPAAQIEATLASARTRLLAARALRPHPALDDKILTAWNGMAIRAFASAARAFDAPDYLAAAEAAADFVLRELCSGVDGAGALTVRRAWRAGSVGSVPGFLEDYALLADGLLAIFEANGDARRLQQAQRLADAILARFWDDTIGGCYDVAADHEALVVRPRDNADNATPCGNSVTADVLLRLAALLDNDAYRARAEQILGGVAPLVGRYPTGFGRYLAATEFAIGAPREIVLASTPATADGLAALRTVVDRAFLPDAVTLQFDPEAAAPDTPLVTGRGLVAGQAAAYVCRSGVCQLPVTDPAVLADLLMTA